MVFHLVKAWRNEQIRSKLAWRGSNVQARFRFSSIRKRIIHEDEF